MHREQLLTILQVPEASGRRALLGAATHRGGGASDSGAHHDGLAEDIAGGAPIASVLGGDISMLVIAAPRWRPVTVS